MSRVARSSSDYAPPETPVALGEVRDGVRRAARRRAKFLHADDQARAEPSVPADAGREEHGRSHSSCQGRSSKMKDLQMLSELVDAAALTEETKRAIAQRVEQLETSQFITSHVAGLIRTELDQSTSARDLLDRIPRALANQGFVGDDQRLTKGQILLGTITGVAIAVLVLM